MEMRYLTLETGGRESEKKRERGGQAGEAQALFRLGQGPMMNPGKSGTCGYIVAGSSADVSSGHRPPARFWTVGTQGIAWQRSPARCLLPCIRTLREKENFQLFHFVHHLKMVHFFVNGGSGTKIKCSLKCCSTCGIKARSTTVRHFRVYKRSQDSENTRIECVQNILVLHPV